MKEKSSLSFVKSGSAALILYITLFFVWGWWNILGIILFPVYFMITDLILLITGKGESKSSKSQLKYYLQACIDNKEAEDTDIPLKIETCVNHYQFMCRRVTPDIWKEMKNHLLLIYTKSNGQSYYEVLELTETATDDEIKNAYRRLSKKYHPDANHGKSAEEIKYAEDMFKKINEAHTILKRR